MYMARNLAATSRHVSGWLGLEKTAFREISLITHIHSGYPYGNMYSFCIEPAFSLINIHRLEAWFRRFQAHTRNAAASETSTPREIMAEHCVATVAQDAIRALKATQDLEMKNEITLLEDRVASMVRLDRCISTDTARPIVRMPAQISRMIHGGSCRDNKWTNWQQCCQILL